MEGSTNSSMRWSASALRRDLSNRAHDLARARGLLFDLSTGKDPAVIFGRDEQGRHGNFHPASYHRICVQPDWLRRLHKVHTASRRSRARHDWQWMELDSSSSSDALLMSIFCHPSVFDGAELSAPIAALLGVDRLSAPRFGAHSGVPLRPRGKLTTPVDRTEVDLVLGSLLVEAKLTETDFQSAAPSLLERYRDLDTVFNVDQLPRSMTAPLTIAPNIDLDDPTVNLPLRPAKVRIHSYQLIRNVLAAYATGGSFCVLCDARRHDLIDAWFTVLSAVRLPDFAWRLKLLTWQELAIALCPDLQDYLALKYGIYC